MMMSQGFRFRLATVLTLRERQRNQAEQHLAAAQGLVHQAQQALDDSKRQQRESLQAIQSSDLTHEGLGFSWDSMAYSQWMQQQQARLQQRIREAEADLQHAKEHYIEAKRAERALEVLKEQQQEAWIQQQHQTEEAMLNELTQQRFARLMIQPS